MRRRQGQQGSSEHLRPPFLRNGKIVSKRWKILHRLGAGTFGEVYAADDRELKKSVALKIELNDMSNEEGLLKMEVEVLKELSNRPHTPQFFGSGRRPAYTYIVISRCGIDLYTVMKQSGMMHLSESTVLRVAVHALYAIKQVHEIGYLHRDVKPSNMVFGATMQDSKIIYLIDYGLARQYAEKDSSTGKWLFRKPRERAEVRGTTRFCSINIHLKKEQSRADDMWAYVYSMIDLGPGLPWSKQARDERVQQMKEEFSDEKMLSGKLECFQPIMAHVRKLGYYDRPDYKMIYGKLMESIRKKDVQFDDPYDWESTKKSSSDQEKKDCSLYTVDETAGSTSEGESHSGEQHGKSDKAEKPEVRPEFPTMEAKYFDHQEGDIPSGNSSLHMTPPNKRKGFIRKPVESEFLI
ncbi:hypothetical protein QR680_018395 [Steinernema hermaphroditum]|uniref:non-specific serine/threonine protein kinase n=1 Tax=Steinernema hermaphroditum TaxID=289476 RepID=A0AA39HHU1_9BILA|nr:hypothetical protein QR680_018395 [Steinernema hermaphroditum]